MVVLATHEWPPAATGAGTRAPVAVLVHGVAGWWRTWWRVGPALADRGWRVIAADQRGHGHSPRIDGHVSVPELAADLGALIETIGAPVDAIVGHSLGAAVSAELAFSRPELMRRLVLEDPPAVTRADDIDWLASLDREIVAARTDFEAEVAREITDNPRWLEEDARQDVEGRQLVDREGILASMSRPTGARVGEIAPALSVPALYLLAAEDRSVFRGDARRQLEAALPANARLAVFDAGHVIHRDRFDEYLAAVVDWSEAEAPSVG
jgi:pimeloyl-ACP methyl ester carboxylesterase